jgi:hypothetical protein
MSKNIKTSEFIYMADTHLGAESIGFFQQNAYYKFLPEILQALKGWIIENDKIDFILHGGDIIDKTTKINIQTADSLFSSLPVPVHLCLGNHDLTEKNSLNLWLKHSNNLLYKNKPCYCVEGKYYALHVIPSHWCESPYYWNLKDQDPNFSLEQIDELENNLSNNSNKQIQILSTHSPIFGIPTEQTGFEKLFHLVPDKFTKKILNIIEKHKNLKLILGAHNHINMHQEKIDKHFVTTNSFSETPFEFKHFKINKNNISMSTVSLLENMNFKTSYNFNKTFVQGRPRDRSFMEKL